MDDEKLKYQIGANIAAYRKQAGLTQAGLAEKLNYSDKTISKWERGESSPDISVLVDIADLFGVSIDSLFTENIADCPDIRSFMRDDDVIRVVQIRGQKILKVSSTFSPGEPPIEIAFPHDCNDETQYFKVEVYGHVIADGAINGDVICHQSINSGTINGDVRSDGNIDVKELNGQNITCQSITDCYKLSANKIECGGNISSANLTCDQIIYKNRS